MTVVDLSRRLTSSVEEYERFLKSSASLIFIEGPIRLDDGPASLELTVGEAWFSCEGDGYYAMPEEGLTLKPGTSAVIETEQVIGLPHNVFGIVTGKGKFIFQGVFISSGKVDPSFYAKLRIGVFNGGRSSITLRKGDPFCYVTFFEMETHTTISRQRGDVSPRRRLPREPFMKRVETFLHANWKWLVGVSIAVASLIISFIKG